MTPNNFLKADPNAVDAAYITFAVVYINNYNCNNYRIQLKSNILNQNKPT